MKQARLSAAFCSVLAMSVLCVSASFAQTNATRTSSFAYDSTSGLLTQEVAEPNQPAYRLETDYVLDAYGNKTQVTVSWIDIATRSSSVTYDAQGQFSASATECDQSKRKLAIRSALRQADEPYRSQRADHDLELRQPWPQDFGGPPRRYADDLGLHPVQ
ncbi:MAG TPA: hypothetical protein VH684_19110 [Xanthobacteraceae bacterium]|jgi:hypothetical protein